MSALFEQIDSRIRELTKLKEWCDDNVMQIGQFDKLRLTPCGMFLTCEVPEAGLDMSALPDGLAFEPLRSEAWPTQMRAKITGTEVTLVVSCTERLRCQPERNGRVAV